MGDLGSLSWPIPLDDSTDGRGDWAAALPLPVVLFTCDVFGDVFGRALFLLRAGVLRLLVMVDCLLLARFPSCLFATFLRGFSAGLLSALS
jgi:hypothetical protein